MSDETTAAPSAPSGDSISIDAAVSLIAAAPEQAEQEKKEPEKQKAAPAEPNEAAPDTDSGEGEAEEAEYESAEGTDDEEQQEQEASEEEQPEAPAVKPPASWTKDAQEAFAKLPPELQTVVSARETEREAFANTKAQEAAQARKERDHLVDFATQEVTKTLQMAQDAIEGEFAGIDWLKLQAEDPQTFLQLDAARKQRLARIQGLQQHREILQQQRQESERTQALATLQQEAQNVKPVLQKLMGDEFSEKTFAPKLTKYLTDAGVPKERIGMMQNGFELTLATKAMLFDQMQAAKAQATKKIASAPTVQKSGGKQMVADSGRTQKAQAAMKRLDKTGSIEAAVAALNAVRGNRS